MDENIILVRDSVKERDAGLVNTILDYAIDNQMSFKEVESCVSLVKDIYLSDGLIKRG